MAGVIGPIGVLTFIKTVLNWNDKTERLFAQIVTVTIGVGYVVTRGPVWVWLASNLITKTATDGSEGVFWFVVALVAALTIFNLVVIGKQ